MKAITIFFFLFAALAPLPFPKVAAEESPISGCPQVSSIPIGDFCSCLSGNIGDECAPPKGGITCQLPSVDPLITNPVAELANPFVSTNELSFTIFSPGTNGRYFEYISLTKGYDANCSYPGLHFTKDFDDEGCVDLFSGHFTLPELVNNCDFTPTQSSSPDTISYLGTIYVSAVDALSSLRGHSINRVTRASHLIQLDLPTFVNISTGPLTVFSEISLDSAVTSQEYNPDSLLATIVITTSVQFPYILGDATVAGPFESESSASRIECSESTGDCLQSTTITFELNVETCDFSGDYAVSWSYGCRNGLCDDSPIPSSVNFTLNSGNICGSAVVLATLSGALSSYKDEGYNTLSSVFVAGETIFFRISLTADVQVQSFAINNLRVVVDGDIKDLISAGTPTPLGDAASVSVFPSFGNNLDFDFEALLAENGIFLPAADAVFTFDVEVDLDVTYKTTFGRKRDVSQTLVSASSTLVLDNTHSKL